MPKLVAIDLIRYTNLEQYFTFYFHIDSVINTEVR